MLGAKARDTHERAVIAGWLQRLDDHWFGPVPAWPLASFRIAVTTVPTSSRAASGNT